MESDGKTALTTDFEGDRSSEVRRGEPPPPPLLPPPPTATTVAADAAESPALPDSKMAGDRCCSLAMAAGVMGTSRSIISGAAGLSTALSISLPEASEKEMLAWDIEQKQLLK